MPGPIRWIGPGGGPARRRPRANQRALPLCACDGLLLPQREGRFRTTTEKCLALNPRDGSAIAYLGMLTATTGEWDRVAPWSNRYEFNPYYPGWFQIALWANAYRQGKYEEALEANAA